MLGWVETGTSFCLIRVSGFLMVAGCLTLHCGIFVLADGCWRSSDGSVIGMGLITRAGLDRSQKPGLVDLACLDL